MNDVLEKPVTGRYSARNSLRPINFYCDAREAKFVQISGDFSNWWPVPMHHRVDGWWYVQALLCHGHHQYYFVVDGTPVLDPMATGVGRNDRKEPVSLIAVS